MNTTTPENGFFEKAGIWMRNSVSIRLFTIGILILILLIPVNSIESLIREREYTQFDAQREISEKWGHPQTITALDLSVPYTVYNKVFEKDNPDKYKLVPGTAYAHFLPENLKVTGVINPEVRYRGIFEAIVYGSELEISGHFVTPDISDWKLDEHFRWDEASISLGISDLRSIQENVQIEWDGENYFFEPGMPTKDVSETGISAEIPVVSPVDSGRKIYPFKMTLKFNGSSHLRFVPLGRTTDVALKSSWPTPSFDGAFLPDLRNIDNDGFDAKWNVINLNRPYPQQFLGSMSGISDYAFGLTLMMPVDQYQKSMRAAKYAVLFITLTFVVFFFMQIINKVRIHPVQYVLVGLALCMFYTLLISLSEQIHFGWAYLIAASAIVALISIYAQGTFKNIKLTMFLTSILVVLYGFIFSIIQLQDFALLVGSIGLFLALATVMIVTRNIDWYNPGKLVEKH
jgi:inner membrane protein